MKSRTEKKQEKIKTTILKDIYKENLRMTGKAADSKKRKKNKKISLVRISSIALPAVLIFIFLNNFAIQEARSGFSKPQFSYAQDSVPEFNETGADNPTPSRYDNFLNELQVPLREFFGLKVKRILIDPGHGGDAPGASGKLGTKEKDLTLDIAKRLRKRLKKYSGYHIMLTREKDITLSLEARIVLAKAWKADLFISIHVNYIPNKPINIIETYYFGPHSDRDALLLAQKENRGAGYTLNDFRKVIRNIGNTLKTQESRSLALYIQRSLYKNTKKQNKDIKNFGIKTAPFVVLLGVEVPSVLTEVSCMSNAMEERKLRKGYYRDRIAGYLEEGIVNYLNKNKKKEVQNGAKRTRNR